MAQDPVYVIAEAGVNHNGSLDMAVELVDAAADAGASAVKFQTFRADRLVTADAPKAAYQKEHTDAAQSQYDMLKRLELDLPAHRRLQERCAERNIDFISTPFDIPSVDLLCDEMHVPAVKVPSGEVTNGPLLLHVARKRRPIALSTGMSTLGEVEQALAVLAFGLTTPTGSPTSRQLLEAYTSPNGRRALEQHVTLLHCTTEYPAPMESVNLRAMVTMRQSFNLRVGYSDHTEGLAVSLAAVALGAVVIEKHVTLDRTLPGPDHAASCEPDALRELVRQCLDVYTALGTGVKWPAPEEMENRGIVRQSLVAIRDVSEGDIWNPSNLGSRRPGTGVSPMQYWELLGTPVAESLDSGDAVHPRVKIPARPAA